MDELPDVNWAIDNVLHKITYLGYGIPINYDEIVELIMTRFYSYAHRYHQLRIFLYSKDKTTLTKIISKRLPALEEKRMIKLADGHWQRC